METETKRIRDIVERKIDEVMAYREKTIKRKHRRGITLLWKLRQDILFLIDNPDYVRTTKSPHLPEPSGSAKGRKV